MSSGGISFANIVQTKSADLRAERWN